MPYWHLKHGFKPMKTIPKLLTRVKALFYNVHKNLLFAGSFLYTLLFSETQILVFIQLLAWTNHLVLDDKASLRKLPFGAHIFLK